MYNIRVFPVALATFLIALLSTGHAAKADTLVMFDSKSCYVCKVFKREMAGKYRRSKLGRRVRLRIVDVNRMGRYRKRVRPVVMTPTFVLMRGGREKRRFVGYAGPANFMANARRVAR